MATVAENSWTIVGSNGKPSISQNERKCVLLKMATVTENSWTIVGSNGKHLIGQNER
jgi:predicted secreted protein